MKRIIAALLIILPCAAQAEQSYYLEDLTWPEVKERMDKGTDTIIIPSGGTEQNGPHIVIGKHNMIVRYTSGQIARQLNALAAPVIAYVPEGPVNQKVGHMMFPGTITLREEGFETILEDAARSMKLHGFKRICFIGDHGGNQDGQKAVADKLNAEWKDEGVKVIAVSDYYNKNGSDEWAKSLHIDVGDAAAHAGFMDAAEMMAIDPHAVRPALIKHYAEQDFDKTGVKGNPEKATVAYGKALLKFKVDAAVAQIRAASK